MRLICCAGLHCYHGHGVYLSCPAPQRWSFPEPGGGVGEVRAGALEAGGLADSGEACRLGPSHDDSVHNLHAVTVGCMVARAVMPSPPVVAGCAAGFAMCSVLWCPMAVFAVRGCNWGSATVRSVDGENDNPVPSMSCGPTGGGLAAAATWAAWPQSRVRVCRCRRCWRDCGARGVRGVRRYTSKLKN